jgi:hypothetical protein
MELPFTTEQFLDVFTQYNRAIWPMQIVGYLLGIAAVALAVRQTRYSDRIIAGILGLYWIWMGVAYHLMNFSAINKAAFGFGTAFVVQGALFLLGGALAGRLTFRASRRPTALVGGAFIAYAMVGYPALGAILGHSYPASPVFGVAPCPTVIFTYGLLLWSSARVPAYLLVVPLLWTLLGFSAAASLGMREDFGLGVAGLLGTVLLVLRDRMPTAGSQWSQRQYLETP